MNLTKNSRFKFVRMKKVEQREENICQRRRQKKQNKNTHTQVTDITSCYAYEAIQRKK